MALITEALAGTLTPAGGNASSAALVRVSELAFLRVDHNSRRANPEPH
jgi:hypothetical protein